MSITLRTARTFTFGKAGRMLKETSAIEAPDCPREASANISCSPWEGLYLEQGNAVEASPSDSSVAGELDRFLDGLLAGK